jgi:hypothetical protein
MEISIESPTRIKMIPETEHEKESLEALWKIIIRCEQDSKVLCPIGAYSILIIDHRKSCLNISRNWEDIFFENLSNILYKFRFTLYGKNND